MERNYSLYDILLCLSNAADLVTPELYNHHQQVAYLAYQLARQMNLNEDKCEKILVAGLMHDIGAISLHERLNLIENELQDNFISVHNHAFRSAKLLGEFSRFQPITQAVCYHHVPWNFGKGRSFMGGDVPVESHILHLADRTCILLKHDRAVIPDIPDVLDQIQKGRDSRFMPEAVDALMKLGNKEYIWLELMDKTPLYFLKEVTDTIPDLGLDDVIAISHLFSYVIDFRSHFTATHSAGVAKTAEKLGELTGMTSDECKMLLVAGYLHDLGKLTISNAVLEKPAALNQNEFGIIRSHTFYTYRLLSTIHGFETINQWASYHHEHIDGSGYPFHLAGDEISPGSRIMAVADVFTAVTEHRPYRADMEKRQIIPIMKTMAAKGKLCPKVVAVLLDNFDTLTGICRISQREASDAFDHFLKEYDQTSGFTQHKR